MELLLSFPNKILLLSTYKISEQSGNILYNFISGSILNKNPLLILIKTTKHRRFGGFTQSCFESTDKPTGKLDGSAFIFSLDKLKSYDVQEGQNAICTSKEKGPIFYGNESCNIYLSDKFFITKGNVAKKGDRYNTNEDYEINFGKAKFVTKEIEIYQILCLF